MTELTAELEAEIRQKYATKYDVFRAETVGGPVMFRTPNRDENRIIMAAADTPSAQDEVVKLGRKCTLFPEAEELDRLFDRYVNLGVSIANAVVKASGLQELDPVKK